MSSRILVVGANAVHTRSRESKFFHGIENLYLRSLEWALAHRAMILMICLVTFVSSFFFYRRVGRDFIPADDQSELQSSLDLPEGSSDRKSTRLNSSHVKISYAVFCLKKKIAP